MIRSSLTADERDERKRRGRLESAVGQRFGKLVVTDEAGFADKPYGRVRMVLCECDCGGKLTVALVSLDSGKTVSCGCVRKSRLGDATRTHGKSRSATYLIWRSMKSRCLVPTNEHFSYYGGRGIAVCDRWMVFENFLADMGERPSGMTLDRINNNGNYEPGNCRWATRLTQSQNTRRNNVLTIKGETKCISEWARVSGVHIQTLLSRIRRGITGEQLLRQVIR